MKMVAALGMSGAAVFVLMGQQGMSEADRLLDQQLQSAYANGLRIAEGMTGGTGGDLTMTLLVGAFVPVIYRVVQIAGEAIKLEHKLSVDRRRKSSGLTDN